MRFRVSLLLSALTLVLVVVSTHLHPRYEHVNQVIAQQFAILRGEDYVLGGRTLYFGQFQNRVLFPVLLWLASTVLSERNAYIALQLALRAIGLILFYRAALQFSHSEERALTTTLLLGIALTFTFNHGWEHPSETIDVIAFALALPWVLADRFWLVLVVAVVASANRESSVFLALVWGAVRAARTGLIRRVIVESAAIGAATTAVVYALRWGFGGARALVGPTTDWAYTWESFWRALTPPTHTSWPLLIVAVCALLVGSFRGRPSRDQWALIGAAGGTAVLSALGGIPGELRIFVPSIVITLLASSLPSQVTDASSTRSFRQRQEEPSRSPAVVR